jgi:hypothetical protein
MDILETMIYYHNPSYPSKNVKAYKFEETLEKGRCYCCGKVGTKRVYFISDFLKQKFTLFEKVEKIPDHYVWRLSGPKTSQENFDDCMIKLYLREEDFQHSLKVQKCLSQANLCPKLLGTWHFSEGDVQEFYTISEYGGETIEQKTCKTVTQIEKLGYEWDDNHSDNLIVRPDGTLWVIDFDDFIDIAEKEEKRREKKDRLANRDRADEEMEYRKPVMSENEFKAGNTYAHEEYKLTYKKCVPLEIETIRFYLESVQNIRGTENKWSQAVLLFDYLVEHKDFVFSRTRLHRVILEKINELENDVDDTLENKEKLQKYRMEFTKSN